MIYGSDLIIKSRGDRVRKAPNVGAELHRGVALVGLRAIALGCNPTPPATP